MIDAADAFADEKHVGQFRKNGTTPYILHPRAVVSILCDAGITEPVILAAALLHDTIEDTDVTYDELASLFGQPVADIVLEVTDDKSLSKTKRKQEQIRHAPHYSVAAALVKIADKIANLRDIIDEPAPDWDASRKLAYYDHARAVVVAMGSRHSTLEKVFEATYLAGASQLKN